MSNPSPDAAAEPLALRPVSRDEPWHWLERGWADLWQRPGLSLGYGLAFTLAGGAMLAGLFVADAIAFMPVVIGAFALIAPMLAVGLYEKSRRLETGEVLAPDVLMFVRTASPVQLAYMGVLLALMVMVWIEVAMVLFALFYGATGLPPLREWTDTLFYTPRGLTFLALGSFVGGLIAFAVFAVSAISVPIMMHRETDIISAVVASVKTVRANFWPMALWAWLIMLMIGFGFATMMVGLIVTFPLIGHATWHAYRGIVANGDGADDIPA